jgi:hypothetical protein
VPSRAAYLRADSWLSDLRALHAQGLSDRAIARELSRRYPQLTFTRRRVHYWRVEMIERSETGRLVDFATLAEANRASRRVHQIYCGFADLLSDYVNPEEREPFVGPIDPEAGKCPRPRGYWTDGIELTPRQADILAVLRDHGPLPRPALCRKLGLPSVSLTRRPRPTPLDRLQALGLVVSLPGRPPTLALVAC